MSVSQNKIASAKLYSPPMPSRGALLGALAGLKSLGQSQPAAAPASPKYQTVGDYYRAQDDAARRTVGRVFEGVAELAPPVLLGQIAAIGVSHEYQADQKVFNLPWDPQGNWRVQAEQIHQQESRAADQQIANLPLISAVSSTGQVISEGVTTAATAAYNGAVYLGNATANAVDEAGQAVADAGKSVGRGLLGALAYTGQGMVDWANAHKKEFQ